MSKTYKLTEALYHKQEGRPDVFIAGKGEEIAYEVAVAFGLVAADKPAAKARKADEVENKAVKAQAAETKKNVKE